MSTMIIRYVVRPEQVESNVNLLEAFFAELRAVQPGDLVYRAYQLDDQVSFVHIVESSTGAAPFASLPTYRTFRDTVEQRCAQPPSMSELHQIGSFSTG